MIEETYVSFEIAKLLKEKGFDEPTREYYEEELWGNEITGEHMFNHLYCAEDEPFFNSIQGVDKHKLSAPTQQMTMRWLREEHNLYIVIFPESDIEVFYIKGFYFDIWTPVGNEYNKKIYKIYEEACEAAIKYCLENLI